MAQRKKHCSPEELGDCKKNTASSTSGQADKKPGASGRLFAITEDHATKTSGDTNITTDSLDMINNEGETDQDDDDDLARERNLLASLIEKLKCKIDESKDRNKLLESSNKTLVDKLKSKIEDFKNKNKCLESSNNHFKEANTELAKNNRLMFIDLKKFQTKLDRDHPLEQVIINPSQSIRTRRQLETDGEMCLFALNEGIYFQESFAPVARRHTPKIRQQRK
nr:hypothetical protein [Tanacetum cinerariifolium]